MHQQGSRTQALLAEINGNKDRLVTTIREYVRSQVDVWRHMPHMAVEADGRVGYSGDLMLIYRYGYFAPNPMRVGLDTPLVDCANGELVIFHKENVPPEPLSDAEVLELHDELDRLDASAQIANLKRAALEPLLPIFNERTQREWRDRVRRECGVTDVFTPVEPRPAPFKSPRE